MPSLARRPAAGALAAALLALPVLSACSTSPGGAALVGDRRISVAQLQSYVRAALVNPQARSQFGADRAGFTRQVLARMISDEVVAAAAAARHVAVTPQDVNAELSSFVQQAGSVSALQQQAAAGGVPAGRLTSIVSSDALRTKLGDSLVASLPVSPTQLRSAYQQNIAQFDQVHAAHILVASRSLARSLLARVEANPSSFGSLAARYSTDTGSKTRGGDLGNVGRGQTVAPFDKAIFSNPPGSYVLVHSQFGWHVVHVIARHTETLAQATPQLKSSLLSKQRDALLQSVLTAESRKLGVRVSPRYGRWDPASQNVTAPSTGPVSGTG